MGLTGFVSELMLFENMPLFILALNSISASQNSSQLKI